jgi:predicted nucleic acid-binding protein
MLVLVDTNVLLRLAEPAHGQHVTAVKAIESLEAQDHQAIVVPPSHL